MHNDPVFVFLRQMEEFKKSDEFQLYKTIRKLRLALIAHRRNYRTLLKAVTNAHKRSQHAEFWRPPDELWRTQSTITTDLLNYFGSKETIINITEVFTAEHFDEIWQKRLLNHINIKLKPNSEYCVFDRLRTYLVHYSIPDVGITIGIKEGVGKIFSVYLHKAQLIKWKTWTAPERKYIESLDGDLNIIEPLKRYHLLFMDTQDKIFLEAINKYRSILETLPSKMSELYQDAIKVRHSESLPFQLSWIRYLKISLEKSKTKGLYIP